MVLVNKSRLLTSTAFTDTLQSTIPQNNKTGYVCINAKTKEYAVFHAQNKKHKFDKDFRPLTLKEITVIAIHYKTELSNRQDQALIVAAILSRMSRNKIVNENRNNIFIRLIHLTCDCARNFFGGYGFNTTAALASRLSEALLQKTVSPRPSQPPQRSQEPRPSQLQPPQPKPTDSAKPQPTQPFLPSHTSRPQLHQTTTSGTTSQPGRSRPIDYYKADPVNCSARCKWIVFNNIQNIAPQRYYNDDGTVNSVARGYLDDNDIRTLVHLLRFVSDSDEIDLRNPKCSRAIVDYLREGNREASEQTAGWLKGQGTLEPALLKECIQVFVQKDQEGHVFSSAALLDLMHIFMDRCSPENRMASSGTQLNLNGPTIISGMEVLLKQMPNNNKVISLTGRLINQPEFNIEAFKKLIRIFIKKEGENPGRTMHYPARDKLFEHFENTSWMDALREDRSAADVALYLQQKRA